jgi:hypothetical protein
VPGGARTDLTAAAASKVLAGVSPAGPVETVRKALARDIVTEVRDLDARLKKITPEMSGASLSTTPDSPSSTGSGR